MAMIFFNDLKILSLLTCLYGRFALAAIFGDCCLTASKDNNHNHTLNRLRESRPALPTQFQCHWPLFLVELTGSPRWVSSERKRLLLQLEVGRHCAVTSTSFNFILELWMFSDVSRCFHIALWLYMIVHDCIYMPLALRKTDLAGSSLLLWKQGNPKFDPVSRCSLQKLHIFTSVPYLSHLIPYFCTFFDNPIPRRLKN